MAGIVWMEAIRDALTDEDARKASIEARGAGVITTSGGIVTLLFGLVTVITRTAEYELPSPVIPALAVAGVTFGVAVLLGLWSFLPRSGYSVTKVDELRSKVDKSWAEADDAARQTMALTYIDELEAARGANDGKARWLTAAMVAQVIGIFAAGAAVAMILVNA